MNSKIILNARNVLIWLYIHFDGNNKKMFDWLSKKIPMPDSFEEDLRYVDLNSFVTAIDDDYPEIFKVIPNPPIVIAKEDLVCIN